MSEIPISVIKIYLYNFVARLNIAIVLIFKAYSINYHRNQTYERRKFYNQFSNLDLFGLRSD